MRITDEMIAQDDERYRNRDVLTELKFCGKDMNERRHTTEENLRFYAWLFRQAAEMIENQKKTIDYMYDTLDSICKEIRESTGGSEVCGLCEWDGSYLDDNGNWANECPGFLHDKCFCMRNSIRAMCGKPPVENEIAEVGSDPDGKPVDPSEPSPF